MCRLGLQLADREHCHAYFSEAELVDSSNTLRALGLPSTRVFYFSCFPCSWWAFIPLLGSSTRQKLRADPAVSRRSSGDRSDGVRGKRGKDRGAGRPEAVAESSTEHEEHPAGAGVRTFKEVT